MQVTEFIPKALKFSVSSFIQMCKYKQLALPSCYLAGLTLPKEIPYTTSRGTEATQDLHMLQA